MENEKEKKNFSPEIRPKDLDPKKRWYVEYLVPIHNGTATKRIREYGKINYKRSLQEKHAEALRLQEEIAKRYFKPKGNILQQALDKACIGKRERTRKTFQNHINNFEKWWKKAPALLTKESAESYVYFLCRTMAPKTAYNNRNTMARLYKICAKDGNVKGNPFEDIKLKKVKGKSKMYYVPDQSKALKEWFLKNDPQTWLACQLIYYCFIRPGEELRFLKIGDIYLDQSLIEVRGAVAKNTKTERVVIPNQLKPQLEQLIKEWPKNYYLFGRRGVPSKTVLGHHTLFKRHRKAILALGYGDSYTMYSWKHTGAKALVDNKTPIKYIQKQLRHSSLEQTDEYLKNLTVSDWVGLRDDFPTAA